MYANNKTKDNCLLSVSLQVKIYAMGLLTIASLCLSACSLLGPVKTPAIETYTLTTQAHSSGATRRAQSVLLVTTPSAAPGYQTSDMIYSMHPYQLSSFTKNRWVGAPTEMLTPLLQQNLQSSGCLRAAVVPPFSGGVNMVLDTQLLMLQQEFLEKGSCVRMAVQVTLSDATSQQVMASRRFETEVPVYGDTVYAAVVAANHATSNILGNIRGFVCENNRSR